MSQRLITDVLLERYLAGDVDAALRAEIDGKLAASASDRERLDELQRDSAAFLVAHPPGPMVARFEEKRRVHRLRWRIGLLLPLGLATAAAVVLGVFVGRVSIDSHDIHLAVYAAGTAKGGVAPMEVATAGDAVQFLLRGTEMGFIAVMGRDPSGNVHVYVPQQGEQAERYDPQQPMLPEVARLGQGAGREEIIGLFSPKPFELAPVVDALKAKRPLLGLLPEGSVTATVPLEKRPEDLRREEPPSRAAE
jgi:hypothetical protein